MNVIGPHLAGISVSLFKIRDMQQPRKASKLLVVDDQPDIRLIVSSMLRERGWLVEEASSGREALEILSADDVDLLVLDFQMPDLTGLEVTKKLLERGYGKPIILFSAYLSEEVEREAKALGISFLDKADLPLLVELIEELTG